MMSHRKIRPTRRPAAPASGNRPRRDERSRSLAQDSFSRVVVEVGGDEQRTLETNLFDEWDSDRSLAVEPSGAVPRTAPGPRSEAPPSSIPPLHGRTKARLAFLLVTVTLVLASWAFRAELLKFATIGGNGVVLCAMLILPLVIAYFTILLVRLLVRKGWKALASFFFCFAFLFSSWVSVNIAASLLCDVEINTALALLPPTGANVYYVRRGDEEARVYLPADRRISVSDLTASHSNYTVPAIEDERLRSRWEGIFDVRSLLRAVRNIVFFHRKEGASTILVQTAKWVRIKNREQTFSSSAKDKLSQWFLALRLSQRFPTPEEQIALYLNLVEVDGAHGVAYASNDFFGAPLQSLNLEQSALLAGILNNPTVYNPRAHPKAALARRNVVLDKIVENGLVKDVSMQKAAPLGLVNPASTAELAFFARAAGRRKGR